VYGTFTSLNSGDMPVRTVSQPLGTGEKFSVTDLAVSLGLAHRFSLRFSAAAQVNYLQETIFHTSAQAFTFTAGTLYRLSADGLRIGATLSNFGTRASYSGNDLAITYDNIPQTNGDNGALPGARDTDPYSVPVTFRVGVASHSRWATKPGCWCGGRAAPIGQHREPEPRSRTAAAQRARRAARLAEPVPPGHGGGAHVGAGLRGTFDDLRYHVDYGWADQGRLEDTHRFSFGILF
jgi:hypothetical protein